MGAIVLSDEEEEGSGPPVFEAFFLDVLKPNSGRSFPFYDGFSKAYSTL